jgi:hypothetical protein
MRLGHLVFDRDGQRLCHHRDDSGLLLTLRELHQASDISMWI